VDKVPSLLLEMPYSLKLKSEDVWLKVTT